MTTQAIDNATWAKGVMGHASAIMADASEDPKARMELALCLDEFAEAYDDERAGGGARAAATTLGDSFAVAGTLYKELGGTFENHGDLSADMRHVAREAYSDALFDVMRAHDWETTREEIDRFAPVLATSSYVRAHEPFADDTFDFVGDKHVVSEHGRAYWAKTAGKAADCVLSDDPEYREAGLSWFDTALDPNSNARYNLPYASPRAVADAVVNVSGDKAASVFVLVENNLVETGRTEVAAAASHAFAGAAKAAGVETPRAEVAQRRLPDCPGQMSLSDVDTDFARFE